MRLLFIGNSATYVHNIPKWLQSVSEKAGYTLQVEQIAKGGYRLIDHADLNTEHGQRVFEEISKGYDIVFLQDNGNCIFEEENRKSSADACKRLSEIIKKSGAKPYFYVRPPYGYECEGYTPLSQCKEYDELFSAIAKEYGLSCVYANRSFAYAIKHLNYDLWGEDHAHTSIYGAYLIVCTFFATLFGVSATCLDCGEPEPEAALALQRAADKVVFENVLPWSE